MTPPAGESHHSRTPLLTVAAAPRLAYVFKLRFTNGTRDESRRYGYAGALGEQQVFAVSDPGAVLD